MRSLLFSLFLGCCVLSGVRADVRPVCRVTVEAANKMQRNRTRLFLRQMEFERSNQGIKSFLQVELNGGRATELRLSDKVNLAARSSKGLSLVRLALSNQGDVATARMLMRAGAPTNSTDRLFYWVLMNDAKRVKQSLQQGANPNGRDRDGMSVLMWAASYARLPLVRQLLRLGASARYRQIHWETVTDYDDKGDFAGKSGELANMTAREAAFEYFEPERSREYLETIRVLERAEVAEFLHAKKSSTKQSSRMK